MVFAAKQTSGRQVAEHAASDRRCNAADTVSSDHGTGDHTHQRQQVDQPGKAGNGALRYRHLDQIANPGAEPIFDLVFASAAGQSLVATASTRFVAAPAALIDGLYDGTLSDQAQNPRTRQCLRHDAPYQRLSGAVSSRGRRRPAIASRARKIRERTVPIGHCIILAISS